jgi:hypothetical protein
VSIRRRTAVLAAVLATGLILAAPAGLAAKGGGGHRAPAPSHCRPGERTLYNCTDGRKIASVCAGAGLTSYRFGPPGAVDLEIASTGHDGKAYSSLVTGGGGGRQDALRFISGDYSYVVYEGYAGQLTEISGQRLDGWTVMKGAATVSERKCRLTSPPAELESAGLPDEPDQTFVMWW